jgi:hypothetical protein
MALIVSTWMWGKKYGGHYIARLQYGVRKHLKRNHRFLVFNTFPGDEPLLPGCMVRLRMFSPVFQRAHGINDGDRVVNLDLDLIVTGPLDPLVERDEPLIILSGANAANPCPFNGSVIGFRAGDDNADLWLDFSLDAARSIPRFEFPDDQGWIHLKRPDAATWTVGPSSGIYAFKKPGWPTGDKLPADARVVCFPGKRDPSQFVHLPWVAEHWR